MECSLLNSDTLVTAGLESSAAHISVEAKVNGVGATGALLVSGFCQFLRFSDAQAPQDDR